MFNLGFMRGYHTDLTIFAPPHEVKAIHHYKHLQTHNLYMYMFARLESIRNLSDWQENGG